MICALLLWAACESAVPLPPKAQGPPPPNARMVKAADVHGFLVQPVTAPKPLAVLLLVDEFNETARKEARTQADQTVLAITPTTSIDAASSYLRGLPAVKEVRIICKREECSEELRSGSDPLGSGH